jgi:RimJ/RimL family protein N-acetyltransferase
VDLEIREIRLEDVATMTQWGRFTDPRYHHFNFYYDTPEEFLRWYDTKVRGFFSRTTGVFHHKDMIGFITYKHINPLTRSAELGIIFDSRYVSMGIGTRVLEESLGMVPYKKVILYVSSFNTRAYRTYVKLGFEAVKEVYKVFENQLIADKVMHYPEDFRVKRGRIYGKYLKMVKKL